MADGERSALGLSVGATNLAAVSADRAITRKPVLTLYRQRPPEVGVPSENPRLNEPGLVITDFVGRVGDAVGIVASDGTTHRSETLVADGLRALAYTATDGWALPAAVAITYPAHWQPVAADALQVALSRLSEWSGSRLSLLPDSAAAMIALQSNPGVPSRGIVAVCDFGGSGTSLTLVDAADDYQPVVPTVRHAEFSGDLIDQVLLTHVVAELSSAGSFDASATSAIGPLNQLRAACRHAKEELSSTTATTLTADVPGYHGDIRVTRAELDDAIRQPLVRFVAVVQETLQRSGIRAADLVAVASVGGGASIPAVTTTLSQLLRAPVITTPRPHMTAAVGAALGAARGTVNNGETALAQTVAGVGSLADPTAKIEAVPESNPAPPLAWSEVAADGDGSGIMPIRAGEYPEPGSNTVVPAPRPQLTFDGDSQLNKSRPAADAWYRRPVVLIVGTTLVVLAIGAAIMIALGHTSGEAPSTPAPSVSTTPESPAPANQGPAPSGATDTQAPASSPTSATQSDTTAPSTTTQPPTTTTTTQAPTTTTQSPTTTSQAPTTTSQAPTTTQAPQPPVIPPIPRIPGVPRFLPQPEPGSG